MSRYKFLVFFLFISLLVVSAEKPNSGPELIIDLAELSTQKEQSIKIQNNVAYQIKIINRMPFRGYTVSAELEEESIAPFSITPFKDSDKEQKSSSPNQEEAKICQQELESLKEEFGKAKDEQDIHTIVSQYSYRAKSLDPDCKEKTEEYINHATVKIHSYEYSLKKGEKLKITITRTKQGDEKEDKSWKVVFYTSGTGKWMTSYGFSFIPTWLSANKEYYSEQSDTVFVINKGNNNKKLVYVPSIFFTWMPYDNINSFGLTAGLGFDLQDPVVFGGLNYTYNYNLSFILGATAHKVSRLTSRYTEGQTLGTNLDSKDLEEKVYRVNVFFSIAFRFGANPFNF